MTMGTWEWTVRGGFEEVVAKGSGVFGRGRSSTELFGAERVSGGAAGRASEIGGGIVEGKSRGEAIGVAFVTVEVDEEEEVDDKWE